MQKQLANHIGKLCNELPAIRYLAATFTVQNKYEKDNITQLVRTYNHKKRVKERLTVILKSNPKLITIKEKMVTAFIVFNEYKKEIDADLNKARKIRDDNNAMMEKFKAMEEEVATKIAESAVNEVYTSHPGFSKLTEHEDVTGNKEE